MTTIETAVTDLLWRWATLPAHQRSQITAVDPGTTSCLDALEHEYALSNPGWFEARSATAAALALRSKGKPPPHAP